MATLSIIENVTGRALTQLYKEFPSWSTIAIRCFVQSLLVWLLKFRIGKSFYFRAIITIGKSSALYGALNFSPK